MTATVPTLTYDPTAKGLRVDLNQLVASRLLVQANSGRGKSRAIRQLLEETFGRIQHFVIDPEGEFSTLREAFPYVLAAKHGGEALASPRTAKLLCRRLVELGASAVFDLYELDLHERREFVKVFLTELVNLPRAMWRPLLIVIDEAHTFAPQSGESQALEAVISLCTLGRKRGFAAVLATQRISKLHKDAAAELNNKMIGRTGLDVDVKRAGDELGFDKDGRQALPHLEPGQFFVYGPAISPRVTLAWSGDVRTTHPEPGQVAGAPTPAPSKVKAMLAQLVDLPKEAEEEARTLDDFKRQVATLRTQLTKAERAQKSGTVVEKPVTVIDQRAIDRAVVAAVKPYDARLATIKRTVSRVATVGQQLADALNGLAAINFDPETVATNGNGHAAAHEMPAAHQSVSRMPSGEQNRPERPRTVTPRASSRVAAVDEGDGSLQKGERAILIALAQYPDGLDRSEISIFTGYKRSTRNLYIQRLERMGFAASADDRVTATDEGIQALGSDWEPLPTGDELRAHWLARLPDGERRVLSVLIDAYPDAMPRDDLDEPTGYKRSTRNLYLQRLARARLVEDHGSGVRASATLFDEARR